MKAIVMTRFGGPDVLRWVERAEPRPRAHELLVRVVATSVNLVDCSIRRGEQAVALPAIIGYDVSGVVETVGTEVQDFVPGDEVYYMAEMFSSDGSYAEYHVAAERIVARKPRNLSHVEAAGIPLAASSAWEALIVRAGLRAGETVLILGASDTALFGIQIARAAGAQVYVVCPPEAAALARQLGASRTIDLHEDLLAVVQIESADAAVEVVFDTIDGTNLRRIIQAIKAHGRIASTVAAGTGLEHGLARNITHHSVSVEADRGRLDSICALIQRGQIVPVIDSVLTLRDAATAHRMLEVGGVFGKVILCSMAAA
ncbi:MAG: zinc-binding dehydrogenase [Gemmatimonadota bacterium]|nr:zinc-binding dehydrogenase [Gemmatimonadales bacterium]MDQ3138737.1 zinc-binding dehydrogenase [Gemmatimonadota bacterium]